MKTLFYCLGLAPRLVFGYLRNESFLGPDILATHAQIDRFAGAEFVSWCAHGFPQQPVREVRR